jgi:hypothetical protein
LTKKNQKQPGKNRERDEKSFYLLLGIAGALVGDCRCSGISFSGERLTLAPLGMPKSRLCGLREGG